MLHTPSPTKTSVKQGVEDLTNAVESATMEV